jgi:hypothetical protein
MVIMMMKLIHYVNNVLYNVKLVNLYKIQFNALHVMNYESILLNVCVLHNIIRRINLQIVHSVHLNVINV